VAAQETSDTLESLEGTFVGEGHLSRTERAAADAMAARALRFLDSHPNFGETRPPQRRSRSPATASSSKAAPSSSAPSPATSIAASPKGAPPAGVARSSLHRPLAPALAPVSAPVGDADAVPGFALAASFEAGLEAALANPGTAPPNSPIARAAEILRRARPMSFSGDGKGKEGEGRSGARAVMIPRRHSAPAAVTAADSSESDSEGNGAGAGAQGSPLEAAEAERHRLRSGREARKRRKRRAIRTTGSTGSFHSSESGSGSGEEGAGGGGGIDGSSRCGSSGCGGSSSGCGGSSSSSSGGSSHSSDNSTHGSEDEENDGNQESATLRNKEKEARDYDQVFPLEEGRSLWLFSEVNPVSRRSAHAAEHAPKQARKQVLGRTRVGCKQAGCAHDTCCSCVSRGNTLRCCQPLQTHPDTQHTHTHTHT